MMGTTRKGGLLAAACGAALLVLAIAPGAWAHYPYVAFDELTHAADVIFIGHVADVTPQYNERQMIVTKVTFDELQILRTSSFAQLQSDGRITLTFAGGQVGDRGLTVCDMPNFTLGERVVIFARADGKNYINPMIGGPQGMFRLISDERATALYPVTAGGAAIMGLDGNRLSLTPDVASISDGQMIKRATAPQMAPAPLAEDGTPATSLDLAPRSAPLDLTGFVSLIDSVARGPAPANPVLRNDDFASDGLPVTALPFNAKTGQPRKSGLVPAEPFSRCQPDGECPAHLLDDPAAAYDPADPRAALCYCGYHDLNLVMEQVPSGWWSYSHNEDAMWMYNQFMDIYRFVGDDGGFGNNSDNEFCGWPSNATINSVYGWNWGSALAVCFTWWSGCQCCEITQSDICFNPAYSWWENFDDTLGNSSRVLYRPVVMHELGHSWGMQRGSCTEDYSYSAVSVMHAYYSGIVEDGWGIHTPEVGSIRDIYDAQTGVIGRTDIGCESYYANGSLSNSWTNKTNYTAGESITVNNLTIENNSSSNTSGVRFRLYLSTNDVISTGDTYLGYWYWDTLNKETWWSGDVTATIPAQMTPGTYYVGIIVTYGGTNYTSDSMTWNNATYLRNTINVQCPEQATPGTPSASDGTYTNRVDLSWSSTGGADDYRVYRNTSNSSGSAVAITGWQAGTTYDDTSATPGVTYYYWLKARNYCNDESAFGASNSGWRALTPSASIAASDGTYTTQVLVSWSAITGASHYRLYRNTTNDSATAVALGSWQTGTSYGDISATPGATYYYWVKGAVSSSGSRASGFSSTNSGWRALSAPGGLTASDGTYPDRVHVAWSVASGASYYRVYRNTVNNSATATAISSWQTSTAFDDFTAAPGVTFYYWVRSATSILGTRASAFGTPNAGYAAAPGGGCKGDVNCDGSVTFADIDPFVARLGCPASNPAACNTPAACNWINADIDGDGTVTFADIDPFVARLGAVCPQ